MKLYLISQSEQTGYDTFDSAVVAAKNPEAARNIQPDGSDRAFGNIFSAWCSSPEKVTVELIGTAAKGTAQGVILASFNAG